MAVRMADLKAFVGATETDHDALLTDCLAEAQDLVGHYASRLVYDEVTKVWVSTPLAIPESILDRAYIEVGADLFHRRNAPNGIANAQFATTDGMGAGAVRIARDPMVAAYKILGRWVTPW